MPNIKYGSKVYEGIENISIPLADGSGNAVFSVGGGSGSNDALTYVSNLRFTNAEFPDGYELILNVPNLLPNTNGVLEAISFTDTKGVDKIKLIGNPNNYLVGTAQMFARSTVRIIDFTEFKIIALMPTSMFNTCSNLEEILGEMDFSNATIISATFRNTSKLKEIRFTKECIKATIDFAQSPLLSNESIQSIIDGLATVETSQTLNFHKDVKAKLTETQLTTITSKNWTLA